MKKCFLVLTLAISAMLLTNCGGGTEEERRTLIMGTNAAFAPFEFIADGGQGVIGQYTGIDVRLAARIAEELDMDIVIHDQEFGGLLYALEARSIDFVAAAMTIRPDRQARVNFTIPYFDAGQMVVVRADNTTINSVADLEGAIVAVQLATTGEIRLMDDDVEIEFGSIARYSIPAMAIIDLLNNSIDALVIDAPVARGFLAQHPGDLRIFSDNDFFGLEQYGMAFHRDDTELLGKFNEVLERLIAEGYVDYLYFYFTAMLALQE